MTAAPPRSADRPVPQYRLHLRSILLNRGMLHRYECPLQWAARDLLDSYVQSYAAILARHESIFDGDLRQQNRAHINRSLDPQRDGLTMPPSGQSLRVD